MKISRRQLRRLIEESIDFSPDLTRMFMDELDSSFFTGGYRYPYLFFYEEFPGNCMVNIRMTAINKNTAYIDDIETQGAGCQQKGYGRQFMETVLAVADMHGVTLELDVAPTSNTPLGVLYNFYQSVGFQQAGNADHPYRMRRAPTL